MTTKTLPAAPCGECGMLCDPSEYHPYAACLMFKGCRNSTVVRANLAAVRAAPAWQPIETAPQNRTVLAGYHNKLGNWRTVKATHYPPQTLPLHEDHDWDDASDGYAAEGWYEETETHEFVMPLECDPTHWMPLPPAPNPVPAGGGSPP